MKIKKIRLKKYKRFHDLTIDLGENPKRIIALIGPNGCGKSSVFDGISFLSNAYSMGYGKSTANVSDTYHKRYNDFNVSHEDVNIIFDNNYSYGQYQEKFKKENKGNTIVAFRSPYRYTSNLLIDKLQKVPEIKTNSNGAKFSLDLDDKMTNNFQLLYAKILNKVQECRMTYDQVINFYLDEINKSLAFCLNITIATLGNILDGHGTLFFKKTDQEELIDYNILSSGEKEVVDMLIDILVKKEDFSDSIFLIDEPELHLNTAIQRNLLREINRLIPENCQIWIATHSIGFLRALQEDFKDISQIIKFDGNYANEPVTLFPMERTRSNFLELYKTAVDDIAELIAPKTIIYCEGGISAEKDGFDAYCYNTIFEKEFPEVLFISSGGCSEMDKYSDIAFMILNKAFNGVTILKLKDKDIKCTSAKHEVTTDNDRKLFLEENEKHRMLSRYEIENYLLDFEIVSKAYPEITEEKYKEIITDIKNRDVKPCIGKLKQLLNRNKDVGFQKMHFFSSLVKDITPDTKIYKELEEDIFKNNEFKK